MSQEPLLIEIPQEVNFAIESFSRQVDWMSREQAQETLLSCYRTLKYSEVMWRAQLKHYLGEGGANSAADLTELKHRLDVERSEHSKTIISLESAVQRILELEKTEIELRQALEDRSETIASLENKIALFAHGRNESC